MTPSLYAIQLGGKPPRFTLRELNIDNNRAEIAIKPFVIGRNYVHTGIM
jgi:hypothetical protein